MLEGLAALPPRAFKSTRILPRRPRRLLPFCAIQIARRTALSGLDLQTGVRSPRQL